jgi:hypothetical protein
MSFFSGINEVIELIWIIPITFFIHELEEWNILRWYKRHYRNLPESTNLSIRLWIVFISIVIFLFILLAYILQATFIFSMFLILVSTFIIVNTIQHIIWTFQYKAYSHGLTTALLCAICIVYVNLVFIINGLLILPFYGIFALSILPIIKTLKSKHEITSEVRKAHEIGILLERVVKK